MPWLALMGLERTRENGYQRHLLSFCPRSTKSSDLKGVLAESSIREHIDDGIRQGWAIAAISPTVWLRQKNGASLLKYR